MPARQCAFEIVLNGQQVADEGFLFRRGLLLGITPGALFEVIEIGGKPQVVVLLRGQLFLKYSGASRRNISDGSGRILRLAYRTRMIGVDR